MFYCTHNIASKGCIHNSKCNLFLKPNVNSVVMHGAISAMKKSYIFVPLWTLARRRMLHGITWFSERKSIADMLIAYLMCSITFPLRSGKASISNFTHDVHMFLINSSAIVPRSSPQKTQEGWKSNMRACRWKTNKLCSSGRGRPEQFYIHYPHSIVMGKAIKCKHYTNTASQFAQNVDYCYCAHTNQSFSSIPFQLPLPFVELQK